MQENTREAVLIQLLQQCIAVVDICIQIILPYTVEPKIICCLWSWKDERRAEKLERSIGSLLHIVDHLCIYTSELNSTDIEKELREIFRKLDRRIPWTICNDRYEDNLGPFVSKVRKIMQKDAFKWNPKYTYVMYLLQGETLHNRSCVQSPFNDLLNHDAYVGSFTDDASTRVDDVRHRFLIRSTLQHKRTNLDAPLWKHHYICK